MKLVIYFNFVYYAYAFKFSKFFQFDNIADNVGDELFSLEKSLNHRIDKVDYRQYTKRPRLDDLNHRGQYTWYPIGFATDFSKTPKRVTVWDINYIVWRDNAMYYAMQDACTHQGSSFLNGPTCENTIACPYHGYVFDGTNGELKQIPGLPHMESSIYTINTFKVVEKGDIVYLNTVPLLLKSLRNIIDESEIFVEPEFYDKSQRAISLEQTFEHYAKFVTVNSLDICHIGFVHTFGNRQNPNPLETSKILSVNDKETHYKIVYEYLAGENSLVNKVYKYNKIIVENEYALPHSTVARVRFGEWTSTIITHALPVSKFKTKLFVKAYRSYWSYDLTDMRYFLAIPILALINVLGDLLTKTTMESTLAEDKSIVDNIDKTYEGMHGKFSIIYDLLSNHYRSNYKALYEQGKTDVD